MSDDIEHIRVWHRTWADSDKSELEALRAENERLREALEIADSWLTMWAGHVANCPGGEKCSCGLTRVRFDVALACIYRAALETKGKSNEV